MKVILLEEVEKLGNPGDIVAVKNGFGRNYLIPKGLARLATKSAVKSWEEERKQSSRKLMKVQDDAQHLADELAKLEVVVPVKVGEGDRIFGSVTAQQVAIGLAQQGVQIDRRKISINEEIRMLGVYSASIKLHSEVTAEIKIRVVAEETEAEA